MSKKSITLHVLAAIFLLLFFLLSRMPAFVVVNQLKPNASMVSLGQVSGTLWQGSVSSLQIRYGNSNIDLGHTQWQVNTWKLLLGQLALNIKAENGKQTINGDVAVAMNKTLTLSDAEIMVDAGIISQFYPVPGVIEGSFDIAVKELELAANANAIAMLDATVVYNNAKFTLSEPVDLGTFAVRLTSEKETIKAVLSDVDAHVGINGDIVFTPQTRSYDANIKLLPKATANPIIEQTLSSFFPLSSEGYLIRKSGQI
jgi:hypothetical protein